MLCKKDREGGLDLLHAVGQVGDELELRLLAA